MMISKTSLAFLFLISLTYTAFAQSKPAVKFTSIYTSLDKGCKTLHGTNGTDDASLCKGAGNYQVRVYSSASSTYFNAELRGTDVSTTIASVSVGFDERKTMLEWRLANGKPFAVIMRVPEYDGNGNVSEGDYHGKIIGQKLVIRGLDGYTIDGSVDTKLPNANAKAREIADASYKPLPPVDGPMPKTKKDRP